MNQTRAELDYKISQLQRKTQDLTPRAVMGRYIPERTPDYVIGSVLTLLGIRMAWGRYRAMRERDRRARLIASLKVHPV